MGFGCAWEPEVNLGARSYRRRRITSDHRRNTTGDSHLQM